MTAEEILSKHTGEKGIYLTHGMIRGSDALEAMEEYANHKLAPDGDLADVSVPKGTLPFKFVEWYSGMDAKKITNAHNRWVKEKGNAL